MDLKGCPLGCLWTLAWIVAQVSWFALPLRWLRPLVILDVVGFVFFLMSSGRTGDGR